MIACTQSKNTDNGSKKETSSYQVVHTIDSLISLFPNLYTNDVQKEKFGICMREELDKKLKEDNTFIEEIPMQFKQMLKKQNGKYVLKFECGEYTTDDKNLISANTKTQFNYGIFAEVNEDVASILEDNAIYKIKGTYEGFVDGKLALPSGKVFDFPSHCYKLSMDKYASVCLGGFLFSNLQIEKVN